MSEQQLAEPAPAHPADGTADSTITPAIELRGVVKEFRSHGESVIEFGERVIVPAPDARPGDKLEITVWPEKMTLTSGDSSNPGGGEGGAAGAGSGRENACALRGTVTEVVYLGTSTTGHHRAPLSPGYPGRPG
jgi:hypothetical protein